MKRSRADGTDQDPGFAPVPPRAAGKATLTQRLSARSGSTAPDQSSGHEPLAFLDVGLGRSLVTEADTDHPVVQRKAAQPSRFEGDDTFSLHLLDPTCAAHVSDEQRARATTDGMVPFAPVQRKTSLADEQRAVTSVDDGVDTGYYEARATVDPAAGASAQEASKQPPAENRRPGKAQRGPRAVVSMDDGAGGDFYDERATVDATLTIDLPPDKLRRAMHANPRQLRRLHLDGNAISSAPVDSEQFALDVAEAQRALGLEVDGIVGPRTAAALGLHDGAEDLADEDHEAGPVQRKADGVATEESVHAAAAQGVAGGGGALPHLERIQQSFGAHDVSGIQAHVGGDAAIAAKTIGAEAYATGNDVAFAGAPDLHTAAHEAAHVVQQRAGVQLKSGVGQEGDPYERQADEVADAVVRGESAASLLDTASTASPGGTRGVQRREGRASMPMPTPDRIAPSAPERDGPRRLDDLERITAKMFQLLPKAMTTQGRGELQRLAAQGRALRDALGDMERSGILAAQRLEDRFVEARTRFENIDAVIPEPQNLPVDTSEDRPMGTGVGIPLLDEGYFCERADHSASINCTLYPQARHDLRGMLADRVQSAHMEFARAVTLQQVEELHRSTQDWGFMAELLYGAASLVVGTALMAIAKRVAVLPRPSLPGVDPSSMVTIEEMPMEGVNPEHVLLGWKQVSSGVRNSVRSAVNKPNDGREGVAIFLDGLEASAALMSQTLREQAPVHFNDQEMVALYHSYDAHLHTGAKYKNQLEAILVRFKGQKIDDIGKELEHDFGRREVVQLKFRGRLRRAMVAKDDAAPVDWAKRAPRFISWVDATFGEYADQVQRARAGEVEIVELDAWDPMKMSPSSPLDGGLSDEVLDWMRSVTEAAQ